MPSPLPGKWARRRVMRRSLLVSALENVEYNYRYTQRLALFELGRVYLPEKGTGERPYEEPRLSILLTGPRRPSSIYPDPAGAEPFDFFDLKGILETLLDRLGFAASPTHAPHPTLVPGTTDARSNSLGPRRLA